MRFVILFVCFGFDAVLGSTDLKKGFNARVSICERRAVRSNGGDDCYPQDIIELEGMGPVAVGPVIGDGAFGSIFEIEDEQIVVKVIEDSLMNVCRESIGLDFLEGLGGFVPKRIPITGGIEKSCFFRTIAMERMGTEFNRGFYVRFARLVEDSP